MQRSIKELYVYCPVHYVDISAEFVIGRVKFCFFNKERWTKITEGIKNDSPEKK
jgi:hypothetical protein